MTNDKVIALTATSERRGRSFSGYVMLFALLLVIALPGFRGVQPGREQGRLAGLVSVIVGDHCC